MSKYPIFRHYLEDEDDKPYYTMNSLSFYYEDMERKQKLIETLAKEIAGYDIRLTENLETIEQEVDRRLADWDKQLETFPDSVEGLLTKWSTDGTIDTVIQTALIDEKIEPLTVKLAETGDEVKKVTRSFIPSKATFAFVDDDGDMRVLTRLKPVLDQYGITATSAVVSDWAASKAGAMRTADLKGLMAAGWEIVSHSKTHTHLTTMTSAQVETELSVSKAYIESIGGNPKHFIYPYGDTNGAVITLMKKYYESAATTAGGWNKRPINTFNIFRNDVSTAKQPYQLSTFAPIVDKAMAEGQLCIFTTHSGNMADADFALIGELINYIQQAGGEIMNYGEAYEKHKNIIEYGETSKSIDNKQFSVGSQGEVLASNMRLYTAARDEFTNLSVPTDFPDYTLTINEARGFNGQGLPEDRSGTLKTYKMSNVMTFTFQEFHVYNRETVYYRFWNGTNWSPWKPTSIMAYGSVDAYTNANSINDFPNGRITLNEVRSPAATGLPENRGGILTTYRSAEFNQFSYQEYKIYDSDNLYSRRWTGTAWTAWKKQNAVLVDSTLNAFAASAPITSFPQDSITNVRISSAGSEGFPDGSSGLLTTYRIGVDDGWGRQEYRKFKSNQLWARYWDTGAWTAWVKLSAV